MKKFKKVLLTFKLLHKKVAKLYIPKLIKEEIIYVIKANHLMRILHTNQLLATKAFSINTRLKNKIKVYLSEMVLLKT